MAGATLDAPPYGTGKLNAADDKLYCTLAHIFSVIIWLWKKDESPAVNVHGKVATNFLVTALIITIPLAVLSGIPVLGCIVAPIALIVGLALFILMVIGALKANDGKLFKYPVNFNLIK